MPVSISGFPVISVADSEERNFLNFVGYDLIKTGIGRFGRQKYDGSTIGSPLILFNRNLETMILSPLNHPMISVQMQGQEKKNNDEISCGPSGKIKFIPAGYEHESVLVFGGDLNSTLMKWGDVLLRNGKKSRPSLFASTKKLSYSTGNGAVYYYTTLPGKNYQETMVAIKAAFDASPIQMGTYEFDSWWYYRNHSSGGLLLWEPR